MQDHHQPRPPRRRLHLSIEGFVQGVGFRPFLHHLAARHGLDGRVWNTEGGVECLLEGAPAAIDAFCVELRAAPPRLARVHSLHLSEEVAEGFRGFEIEPSRAGAAGRRAWVLPDADLCVDCAREISDPTDRRHRHPFVSCVHCGPRYSIVEDLPYDRPRTTMAAFEMCPRCRREYEDPTDRRHHAQPIACPDCGPRLWLTDSRGQPIEGAEQALGGAAQALGEGRVLALRGLGGFHLAVNGADEAAVARLRRLKGRPTKPLAVMVADLETARALAQLPREAAQALSSPASPIVLLERRRPSPLAEGVAPGLAQVGLMLAYTPLHRLLLRAFAELPRPGGGPAALVMTSGNRSGEPICTENDEALAVLGAIADRFLLHDREIAGGCDDSVGRLHRGELQLWRRARGYVPAPLVIRGRPLPRGILGLGAELKASVAISREGEVILGRYLGDLVNLATRDAYLADIERLLHLFGVAPRAIAHDLHPDFISTRQGATGYPPELPRFAVQHHHAHLAACLLEHDRPAGERALGVILDGAGYGPDGTVWGGELLLGDAASVERAAHFKAVALPGGDAAVRHPRRIAFSYLLDAFGEGWAEQRHLALVRDEPPQLLRTLGQMIEGGLRSPRSSGAGRLFDAVAALLDLPAARGAISHEGEAAIALEQLASGAGAGLGLEPYPFDLEGGVLDFAPTIRSIVSALGAAEAPPVIAARFHETVSVACARAATAICSREGVGLICLSGGVFQNHRILTSLSERLEAEGLEVLTPHKLPPNDGAISAGQVAVAAALLDRR